MWPVILTQYNLQSEMCMKREFLFLSILVSGSEYPKRSFDVFCPTTSDRRIEEIMVNRCSDV